MESDARFYRRRANEEIAAAGRAVTEAARQRRMQLAGAFLERLKTIEDARDILAEAELSASASAFDWTRANRLERA
jgi:hypothetical protein